MTAGWMQALHTLWDPTRDIIAELKTLQKQNERPEQLLQRLKMNLHRRPASPYQGDRRGVFKGQGFDLHNLREYQPGDDIRKIDWHVLARTGVPHVKEHYEEKQVPVWFFVDATASMHFGQVQSKLAYAKQLVGLLGMLALEMGNRVGLVLWQGAVSPRLIPPKVTETNLQWILQEIETAMDEPLNSPVGFPDLTGIFQHHSLVFLLSDFTFFESLPMSLQILSRLAPKHRIQSVLLTDPVENGLCYGLGWLPLSNAQMKGTCWANLSDRWMIKEYKKLMQKELSQMQRHFVPWSRLHQVNTAEDPLRVLMNLVKTT